MAWDGTPQHFVANPIVCPAGTVPVIPAGWSGAISCFDAGAPPLLGARIAPKPGPIAPAKAGGSDLIWWLLVIAAAAAIAVYGVH